MVMSDKGFAQEEYDSWIENADEFIKKTKSQRFISIPKDYYKDLKPKITVNITGEQRNKAATLESLSNILTVYASNPNISSDPVASQLLARIIELSGAGISPVQITSAMNEKTKNDALIREQTAGQSSQQKKLGLMATATKI